MSNNYSPVREHAQEGTENCIYEEPSSIWCDFFKFPCFQTQEGEANSLLQERIDYNNKEYPLSWMVKKIKEYSGSKWKNFESYALNFDADSVEDDGLLPLTAKESVMVGFEEETKMLIEKLVTGPRQLDVISIAGMPGLGKTTLAKRLYDHEIILDRFDIRMWCCSSQLYVRKNLLLGLLRQISKLDSRTKNMADNELAEMLYRNLKGKRYLIVVDDVWRSEEWDEIKSPFPDDDKGSRIILTTRLEAVATYVKIYSSPHCLRLFTKQESWMLLEESVFGKGDSCPETLEEVGKQIAKKCGGLPLAIVLIAGLLSKLPKDQKVYWEEVAENLKSNMKDCMGIVESSYEHLPFHLQRCFRYFASFLEDQKVSVHKLIQLWIAENFVEASSTTSKSLEMVAMDYLMDLVSSNLVMVAKRSSLGGVKAVQIHDIVHEYILVKAKKSKLPSIRINGVHELNSYSKTLCKRVNILAPCQVLPGDKLIIGRGVRTLNFLPCASPPFVDLNHFSAPAWKRLRVLDLGTVGLRQTLVSELQYLIHLKYLELQMYFLYIPDSIANLKKLEAFVVTGDYGHDNIPNTIWDLVNLRLLRINPLYILREELQDLDNLQICSDLVIFPGRDYMKFMRRFPNLVMLSCKLYGSGTPSGNFFPAFDSLIQLKSLKIDVSGAVVDPYGFEDFIYPENLKKLTLACLELPWSKISTIGKLPNLEVLKLEGNAFRGRQWNVEDGEFPNLKVLKLRKLDFSEWTASDDAYPSLQQVLVQSCRNLEEIPESFGTNCTMQLIEVRSCSDSAVNAALKIKEMQIEEMGNSEFKVVIWK